MIHCWRYIRSFGLINIQVECFPRTRGHINTQVQCNASPLPYQISQLCPLYFEIPGRSNYSAESSQVKVKIKQSHNRPGVAQRVPGGLGSLISMTFGT